MDRGLVHKSSSPLVGEMGEGGHGWWSVNNLRPPFEQQHHPSLFMPSSTTTTAPSSALHAFSSLLLANQYPLPTTSCTSPWNDSSSGSQGLGQQDSWSQLILGGLVNGEERYKEAGQMLFPSTIGSDAGGSGAYIFNTTASSHGSSTADRVQLPWGSVHQHHKALQQKGASSPRSSFMTSTTSLGSNMLEFSNNSSSSPRECISTVSGSAFKKARTQEPSQTQSTVKVVRKERLGDRITTLHQLVSPFGKTDTASVLLEAIGYIRFLHSQIEALSSPYVGGGSNGGGGGCGSFNQQHEAKPSVQQGERRSIFPEDPGQLLHDTTAMKKRELQPEQEGISCCDEERKDLRSRGLCLVPVSCTLDVVAGPADYWGAAAPAFGMGFGR